MIRWDSNEIEALADETAKHILAHPDDGLTVSMNKAMKTALHSNRHRKITSWKQAGPEFLKYVKMSLSEKRPALSVSSPGVQSKTVIEYRDPDINEVLINCPTNLMVNVLFSRLVNGIESLSGALRLAGLAASGPLTATIERPKSPPAELPRLGIAGLDAEHFYALQNRLSGSVLLSYVNQERPQAPPSMDHVVVVGTARRYWKDFESPKVRYCEGSSLGDVSGFIKAELLNGKG